MAQLTSIAERLLRFAAQWHPTQLEGTPPYNAIQHAARRFLVVDGLWNICVVVGPKMNRNQWWERLMAHVSVPQSLASYPLPDGSYVDWRPFLALLRHALEDFRQGKRPSPEVIVALKRMIFCDPKFHVRFRERPWDPWRRDDEDYKLKTGES